MEGCCDPNSTSSEVYIFGEQLSSFVFLLKDSWTLDLRTRLEKFLSLTLKASQTPRLLTLFVSFWENTLKIIKITVKRQYNLSEEYAAKIYCTIAVTLQFNVFGMKHSKLYIQKPTFEKVMQRQCIYLYETAYLLYDPSLLLCVMYRIPQSPTPLSVFVKLFNLFN